MAEPSTVSRTDVHTFSSLPFDIHVYIVKLLNLRDALVYAELSNMYLLTVNNLILALGSMGQIMLCDSTLI